jgi:hypothetical protein
MESAPLIVHCCHCRWCQRETGSAFALNAMIETDRVTVLAGEPVRVAVPSQSGKGQAIRRCPACEVALWSHYAGAGEKFAFVRVGALEEPDRCPPACLRSRNSTGAAPFGPPRACNAAKRSWPENDGQRVPVTP